jgi:hypothetical protein
MEDPRLASLIDLYVAGVLSAGETAELRERLLGSGEARAQFDHHIACHEITHSGTTLPTAAELVALWNASLELPTARGSKIIADEPHVSTSLRAWVISSALASCVLVGLIIGLREGSLPLFQPPTAIASTGDAVASLRHAAGVKWADVTNEIFPGETFIRGPLRIVSGAIQLEFKSGARLVVEGPANLQLISTNEAFLHSGKVTAYVPNKAQGFKITAPSVAVTDLGTEFGLQVVSNAPAEVHVFSGVIEMARLTTDPQRMMQGQAAQIRGKRVRDISLNTRAFIFEPDLVEREANEQQERYRAWKSASGELSSDPAALVHYTFEDQPDGSRQLANHVSAAPAVTAGSIAGTWTDGRWPDKRALTFGAKTDRIRFTVPNTLTSLTYMAWLRIDSLVNLSNALAITETMALGEVHWQVYRDGRVTLSSRSGSGGGSVDQSWDRGISPPVFTAERLGKWTHLTSVYDSAARTINHYVNGEFISSTPIKRQVKLKLGAVEIGNWGVRVEQPKWASMKGYSPVYLGRYWNGSIDEFALLSRAMTPEEIRRYYQQGRVSTGIVVANSTR